MLLRSQGAAKRLQIARLVSHQIIITDALIDFFRKYTVKGIPKIAIYWLPLGQADDEFQKERKYQHHDQQYLHRRDQQAGNILLVVGIKAAGFPQTQRGNPAIGSICNHGLFLCLYISFNANINANILLLMTLP